MAAAFLAAAIVSGCVASRPPDVRGRLVATIIPEIDFRQAGVREAIAFLNSAQRPDGRPTVPVLFDPSSPSPTNTITFSATDVSAWEAVQITAHICGLWLHTYPDKVVFSTRCCPGKPGQASALICPHLETRRYRSQDVVTSFLRYRSEPTGLRLTQPGDTLDSWSTAFLAELGVKWHQGSSFTIDTNSNIITVINAPEALDTFEAIVATSDVDNWPQFERLREAQPKN